MPRSYRNCAKCGTPFDWYRRGPGAKYCPVCSEIAKKEGRSRAGRNRSNAFGIQDAKLMGMPMKCNNCGYDAVEEILQLDHIKPWTLSHDNSLENLRILCPDCHTSRMQKPLKRGEMLFMNNRWYDSCYFCQMKSRLLEIHHIIPRRERGESLGDENLIPLCPNCHKIFTLAENKGRAKEWFSEYLTYSDGTYIAKFNPYLRGSLYWGLSMPRRLDILFPFYQWLSFNWRSLVSGWSETKRRTEQRKMDQFG